MADESVYALNVEQYRKKLMNQVLDTPLSEEEIEAKCQRYEETSTHSYMQYQLKNRIYQKYSKQCNSFESAEALKKQFMRDAKKIIEQEYPLDLDLKEKRKLQTQNYLSQKIQTYVSRPELEAQLTEFCELVKSYAVVTGESGMGKSTLLAKWHYDQLDIGEVDVLAYYADKNAPQ